MFKSKTAQYKISKRKPLSQYHPALYFLSTWLRRSAQILKWQFDGRDYAKQVNNPQNTDPQTTALAYRVKKHQSRLIRKLGDSDLTWQHNKIINLKIAAQAISGIVIHPKQTFSFCQLVGRPTVKKGYVEGMELSFGKARGGIGGGICQIANMIHWLVLHSPLQVVQRSQHSFDPFPDNGCVLPFGSGAAVFYNYIDYQFYNPTEHHFQINLWFSDKNLEGELRCNHDLNYVYHVYEQNHKFIKIAQAYYRQNEIWRKQCEKYKSGEIIKTECISKNFARVMYTPTHIDEDWSERSDL